MQLLELLHSKKFNATAARPSPQKFVAQVKV